MTQTSTTLTVDLAFPTRLATRECHPVHIPLGLILILNTDLYLDCSPVFFGSRSIMLSLYTTTYVAFCIGMYSIHDILCDTTIILCALREYNMIDLPYYIGGDCASTISCAYV